MFKSNIRTIITRTILIVSMVSLFTDVASEMLYPVMPVFLRSIGFSVLMIGILEGLAECVAGISKGFFGHWSDHIGKRVPFIRWGYTMSAFSKPMMALFTWPWWIFIARTLDRLGKGIRTSARDALLSDETTKGNKGKVFGFHRGMDTLGAAIGPFVALLWLYFRPGDYKWLFIIAFFPGLIAIFLTQILHDKKKAVPNKAAAPSSPGFFAYLGYWKKSSGAYRRTVSGLLAFTLFNSSDAFLLLALKQQGFSDTHMISFYIFYNLIYAFLSYPLGSLGDKLGLKKVMVAGLSIFALVYFSFGFATATWQFAILFMVYAIYAAATEGIAKAWISNQCKPEETATAIGFFNSFSSVFAFIASSAGGLIWNLFGPRVMFIVAGTGVALVVLYFVLPFSRRPVVQ